MKFLSDYWQDPPNPTQTTVVTIQQANAACNLAAQWYYESINQQYKGWGSDVSSKSQMPWFLECMSLAAKLLKIDKDIAFCALWSRCMQETGAAWYQKEQKSDEECERLYGYQTSKGKELGNTEPGDGAKYKGRGVIQLTGKANYQKAGQSLQTNFVDNPESVIEPQNAAKIIYWYIVEEMPARHSWNTAYAWLTDNSLSLEERSYRMSACINWGYFQPWDRKPSKSQIHGWDMTQMYGKALAAILGLPETP